MIDLDKLSKSQRALVNAFVIGVITFLSTLIAEPGIPSIEHLYSAFVAAALICAIRIRDLIEEEPPKQETGELKEGERREPFKVGMVV